MNHKVVETPFFEKLILVSDGEYLVKASFLYDEEVFHLYAANTVPQDDPILLMATEQLEEYFSGKRKDFTVPLKVKGTEFQEKVWQTLNAIPYGEVLTYKQIAEKVGSPKSCRAVGGACRANPIVLIIPCHRVLGTNGSYTGFSGDKIYMKESLLKFEDGQEAFAL